MSALTFTLKQAPVQRLDVSCLVPEKLTGLSVKDIASLPLYSGREKVSVGDVFSIKAGDASELVFADAHERLDHIGAGMANGSIVVQGNAGAYVGLGMRGGRLDVAGSVDAYAASGMRAGLIRIGGNAGDFLGGPRSGEMKGMQGGAVLVGGNVGARAGDRMRRGTLIIAGDVGDYAGSRMIAGTVAVLGSVGDYAGFNMTRGTLLLAQAPQRMLSTFNDCGEHSLNFLTLLRRAWSSLPAPFARFRQMPLRMQRWMGDVGTGGKGEILIWR